MPQTSFIDDYLLTMKDQQPAYEYGVWSMLSTLSVFAGKRFSFPFGPLTYYTNLYVVLVGEPGNGKSTAMSRAKNIVRAAKVCPVAATQITKEALTQKMSGSTDGKVKKVPFDGQKFWVNEQGNQIEYNQYAIFANELVEFIAVNPQGFLDFLTGVWDEPMLEVETKGKGSDYVMGPYITMLACMTPEKLKGYMKMSILTGGFARRTAFMFSAHKNIVHIPSYSDEQRAAELRCIEFGQQLQLKGGVFGWTDRLRDFYCEWNAENERTMRDKSPNVRGWYQSKGEMLFKLSMLIALANENGNNLTLDIPHYKLAMHYTDMIEETLDRVFEGTGINPNAAVATQMARMLEGMGAPMSRKKLESMFFDQATSLSELRDTLDHLINVGRLKQITVNSDGRSLGTAIGTPQCMDSASPVELVRCFGIVPELPPTTDMGSQ